MNASDSAEGKQPVKAWTKAEIDAHEARGGAWAGGGRPIPGIDYATLPSFMQPVKTSRDWSKATPPEDD